MDYLFFCARQQRCVTKEHVSTTWQESYVSILGADVKPEEQIQLDIMRSLILSQGGTSTVNPADTLIKVVGDAESAD